MKTNFSPQRREAVVLAIVFMLSLSASASVLNEYGEISSQDIEIGSLIEGKCIKYDPSISSLPFPCGACTATISIFDESGAVIEEESMTSQGEGLFTYESDGLTNVRMNTPYSSILYCTDSDAKTGNVTSLLTLLPQKGSNSLPLFGVGIGSQSVSELIEDNDKSIFDRFLENPWDFFTGAGKQILEDYQTVGGVGLGLLASLGGLVDAVLRLLIAIPGLFTSIVNWMILFFSDPIEAGLQLFTALMTLLKATILKPTIFIYFVLIEAVIVGLSISRHKNLTLDAFGTDLILYNGWLFDHAYTFVERSIRLLFDMYSRVLEMISTARQIFQI